MEDQVRLGYIYPVAKPMGISQKPLVSASFKQPQFCILVTIRIKCYVIIEIDTHYL